MHRHLVPLLAMALCVVSFAIAPSSADACRVVRVEYLPAGDHQAAIWLEDEDGNFIETVQVTRLTGTYGLGNRPGMQEFNTAYRWPYGKREGVLPIWAHARDVSYPRVVFQDGHEDALSHHMMLSTPEPFYCRPLRPTEDIDVASCATTVYTDKGRFHESETSMYPPRNDIREAISNRDHQDIEDYADVNDLDAVSRATPPAGLKDVVEFRVPADLPSGRYRLRMEVSAEYDQNEHWQLPSPDWIDYANYGRAWRGQPSILYEVDFDLDDHPTEGITDHYVGYGAVDGADGDVRPPDETITMGIPGSGGERLLRVEDDGAAPWRVRVTSLPREEGAMPDPPLDLEVMDRGSMWVDLAFTAPEDHAAATDYEIRFMAWQELTPDTFESGAPAVTDIPAVAPGEQAVFRVEGLVPNTPYWVGVRALDECRNASDPIILEVTTPAHKFASVSACFIATAAYGSGMEAEVNLLRKFRDQKLRKSLMGRALIGTYETLSPPVADFIRGSESLRAATRLALAPVVGAVRWIMEDSELPSAIRTIRRD